jgi:hypothetical protein
LEEEEAGEERGGTGVNEGSVRKKTLTTCLILNFETALVRSLLAAKPGVSDPPRPKLQVQIFGHVCMQEKHV